MFYTPGKPFPLFHRLEFVYGKDRATGAGAKSAAEVVEQMDIKDVTDGFGEDTAADTSSAANVGDDNTVPDAQGAANVNGTPPTATNGSLASSSNEVNRQGKGKRKACDNEVLERLVNSFDMSIECSRENARLIASAIVGQYGERLGDMLAQFNLTLDEVVEIAKFFASNPDLKKIFWELNAEQREAFARNVLSGV